MRLHDRTNRRTPPSPRLRTDRGRRQAPTVQPLERRVLMAAGDLDSTFGVGGTGVAGANFGGGEVTAVAGLSGGRVLMAGGGGGILLARLRADGSLDPTFSGDGKVVTGVSRPDGLNVAFVTGMVVQSDGRVVVAGSAGRYEPGPAGGDTSDVFLARYNTNGTLDTTFGAAGTGLVFLDLAHESAADVALAPGGRIVIAGAYANPAAANPADRDLALVARYNANGRLDTTFGGGDGVVLQRLGLGFTGMGGVAVLGDGRVLLAAKAEHDVFLHETQEFRRTGDFTFLRLTVNGDVDPTFKGNRPAFWGPETFSHIGDATPHDLLLLPDGRFVAGGVTAAPPYNDRADYAEAVYAADGTRLSGFTDRGQGEFGETAKLALTPDGRHARVVDGAYTAGEVSHPTFSRNTLPIETPRAVAIASDGKVLVAGDGFRVARYQVSGAPFSDGNDQFSEARAVALGSTVTGQRIDPGIDVDMYKFTAAAGQRVRVDADPGTGVAYPPLVQLFDATGQRLASSREAPDGAFEHTLANAGTYYVGVSNYANDSYDPVGGGGDSSRSAEIGGYSLRFTSLGFTGDGDDQISEATPVAVNFASARSIAFDLDVDVFSVEVNAGQRVTFDVDRSDGSSLDSFLRLFDAAGNELARNNNAAGPDEPASGESFLDYSFAAAGTYYVGVSGNPNAGYNPVTGDGDAAAGSTGAFLLVVSEVVTPPPEPRPDPRRAFTIEAEAGRLAGGAVLSSNPPGFTGTGYVDFVNARGDSLEWTFTAATNGQHQMTFRYANGGAASRPMEVRIDGQLIRQQSAMFPPTGSWSTWGDFGSGIAFELLTAGEHTIRLTAVGSSGPNIDSMTYRATDVGLFQAESAARQGAVVGNTHGGFTGAGYVDFVNAASDFIEWTFEAPSDGSYELNFRYANGGPSTRPMRLSVDGATLQEQFPLMATGSWTTWQILNTGTFLTAGTHTVRLTATGASGPNVDWLVVN